MLFREPSDNALYPAISGDRIDTFGDEAIYRIREGSGGG
jgi:hypothetical protein